MTAQRFAGEIFEDPSGAGDLSDTFGKRLALFPGQQAAQLLAPLQNQAADAIEEVGPHFRRAAGPGGKRLAGRCDSGIDIRARPVRKARDNVARIRRVFTGVLSLRRNTLAVDVVRKAGNTHGLGWLTTVAAVVSGLLHNSWMASRLRPLVSGTYRITNSAARTLMPP